MPKVSIIIPTLNRAHLLKSALKSALEQDYKNLEIVVCDDFSEDNTKEVVEAFNDKRIVYIRAEKRLNISDTFEFALEKAEGEYITFLADTAYLLEHSISTAMQEIEKFNTKIAMWRNYRYCSPDWLEFRRRNTLQIPKVTLKSYLLNSKIYLERFYNNIREPIVPRSINSLCHRSIIEKAINIQGRFFSHPTPDYTSTVSMLINSDEFLFIDKLLYIGGIGPMNIGASLGFNFGKGYQDFLKGFNQKLEEVAFLGIPVTSAYIIKGLENVRNFYLDKCPEINMKNAISEVVDSLVKSQIYGANARDYWKILNNYISTQYNELKFAILKRRIKSKIKWRAVKAIRSLPYFYNFESLIRNARIIKGNKYKFSNIEECAKVVEEFNNLKKLH